MCEEYNICQNVIQQLKKIFNCDTTTDYEIREEVPWKDSTCRFYFDVAVYHGGTLVLPIEIKRSLRENIEAYYNQMNRYLMISGCQYAILTDGERWILFSKSHPSPKDISCASIANLFVSQQEDSSIHNEILTTLDKNNILKRHKNSLKYDSFSKTYYFTTEQQLFQKLFKERVPKRVCRYMSFDAFFCMVNERKIQMSSLVAMNDKSEIDYARNKVYGNKEGYEDLDVFVSSCCSLSMRDQLTMWRLYGDDGRGVCLTFTVAPKEGFTMGKVLYGERHNYHEMLCILRQLYQRGVRFNQFDEWQHFFKPYEYKTEKEYRILLRGSYAKQNGGEESWIKTSPHSIVNKVIKFDMDDNSPLQLSSVILGPNFAEYEINQLQIKRMLEEKKIGTNIKVETSRITNYR